MSDLRGKGLRGQDLNLRPSGYEPDELPGCSTPRLGGRSSQTVAFISPEVARRINIPRSPLIGKGFYKIVREQHIRSGLFARRAMR